MLKHYKDTLPKSAASERGKKSGCPICRLCFIAWTFGGRFNNGRCTFCKRMQAVWNRMTPHSNVCMWISQIHPSYRIGINSTKERPSLFSHGTAF